MSPMPEGFKPEQRIENAASIRLTDSGIGFLQSNIGTLANGLLGGGADSGVLKFEIPSTSGSFNALVTDIKYDVCKDGPKPNGNPPECVAEIDLANAKLTLAPVAPHNLKVTGPLPVRLRKLPLKIQYFCVFGACAESNVHVALTGNDACDGDQTATDINLDVNVDISIDSNQQHSRFGYSKIGVDVGLDEGKLRDSIRICGGFSATLLNGLLSLAGGLIIDPLLGTLKDQVEQALCLPANDKLTPACPNGTQNVDGICRYGADANAECASIVLGTEGKIDIGGLLQGISGGATGGFDFLLAAGGQSLRNDNSGHHWGDLNPVGNGITLGMYGGTEPTPLSSCVPAVPSQLPTGIPVPDELLGNTLPDWPMGTAGPHFGLGLSERFANYALQQIYNSGALCLGISADAIGTPVTSTILGLGLGAKSLPELGLQKQAASVAFLLRPQKPPTIAFGNGTDIEKDPLFDIKVEGMAIDFYLWSLDRYIRAMTVTTDIGVPANLSVTPEGLTPVIKAISLSNTVVTNHEQLLRDDPAAIAEALEGLVGQLVGGALGGALSPIDLNSSLAGLGLKLDIPESVDGKGSAGLRKLTKGSDEFLGIFAALGVANAPPMMKSSTKAEVLGFEVDPAGLRLETWTPHNAPRARIRLGSNLDDGTRAIEWQHRIDNGPWRPFSRARDLDLTDPVLRNQGVHKIQVRSRVAGEPMTLDPEPRLLELRVDDMAPEIRVVRERDRQVRVEAADLVSGDRVQVRVRLGVGASAEEAEWGEWSAWQPALELASIPFDSATWLGVEAKDEGENVATVTQSLIRGQAEASGSGCQCAVEPGANLSDRGGLGLLLGITLAGGLALRRSRGDARRALASRSLHAASADARRALASRSLHAASAIGFVLMVGAAPGCSCSEDAGVPPATGCRARGDCEVVAPGLVGAYTSAAAAADGSVWVSGYLEGNWDPDYRNSFGDLVVGRANPEGVVGWKVIDGTNPEEIVDPEVYDPLSFRGGKTESGDDVGLWTSIALDAAGNPGVAYYDVTHRALKYAHAEGDAWSVTTVQFGPTGSDYGSYAKLRFVGGRPVIAYHFIESQMSGIVSGVRLATGADVGGSSWAFEDVVADAGTPCKPALCAADQKCLKSGACVAKKDGCESCGSGEECVDDGSGGAACKAIRGSSDLVTYPNEVGLYIAMVVGSDGLPRIAYYDRPRGNVVLATKSGPAWTLLIVDGEEGTPNAGDKGIGLSLATDDKGDLLFSYVDGLSESLVFRTVQGGATVLASEVVDNGLGAMDGHHLVGDDSNLFVTPSGEKRVTYQDATTGKLMVAIGTLTGDKHDWQRQVVTQDGFAGFFSQQLVVQGAYTIANFWRVGNPIPKGNVRFVSLAK
ncbi:MAG: hypothetical protein FJ096_03375 [Deltaproteobacteria bacterium]|nr:hypothetical protein [Deltaproteobacteria bacterium]